MLSQNAFEYLDDGLSPAAFTTQTYDGRTVKATDSHKSVKVSVERDHDGATLNSQSQDVLILRFLHSDLGCMPAFITEIAKQLA